MSANYFFGNTNANWSTNGLSPSDLTNIRNINQAGWSSIHTLNQGLAVTSSPTFYNLYVTNEFKLKNSGFTVTMKAPTLAASYTLTLPVDDGTPGQHLTTDGSGNLTWANASGFDQNLNTTDTPQFAKLGINQAAGTERLEVTGNIKATGQLIGSYAKSGVDPYQQSLRTSLTGTILDDDANQISLDINSNANTRIDFRCVKDPTLVSYGCLGNAGTTNPGAISWRDIKVGINAKPGAKELTVGGDTQLNGSIYMGQAAGIYTTPIIDNQEWAFYMTPGAFVGSSWNVYNMTTSKYVISASVPEAGDCKVGINQKYGTETLEVNGTLKTTGNVNLGGSITTKPNQAIEMTAAANSDMVGFTVTPGTYSGCRWYVYDQSTSNFAISALIPQTGGGDCRVGINQDYGTNTLEVNGTFKAAGNATITGNIYMTPNQTINITSTGNTQTTGFVITPGAYTQTIWSVYDQSTSKFAISALIPQTGGGDCKIGINQDYGTEVLEVNGNVKSSHNIISNTGADWYTQYMVNGKPRYYWSVWNAETGSNVGSDLVLSGLLDDDTTPIYPFTVKRSTGYVGINNFSPTEQLAVAGNALATGDMKAYRFHNSNHTLVGYESGKNLSTAGGNNNSALTIVGYQAGYTGTTSNQYSTLVGYQAGYGINGASSCTAIGALSQYSLTSAIGNSSLGTSSLTTCTTGSYNTAIGGITLQDCTTGASNTVIGYGAGNKTTTGALNVYVGNNAGLNHTTAYYMTCVGCQSGEGSGSPTYCTLVGYGTDVATDATNAIVIGAGITGAPSNTVNIGNATNTNVYLKNLRQYAGGANEKGPIYWDSVTGELYYH
jgi:hypothetical protein